MHHLKHIIHVYVVLFITGMLFYGAHWVSSVDGRHYLLQKLGYNSYYYITTYFDHPNHLVSIEVEVEADGKARKVSRIVISHGFTKVLTVTEDQVQLETPEVKDGHVIGRKTTITQQQFTDEIVHGFFKAISPEVEFDTQINHTKSLVDELIGQELTSKEVVGLFETKPYLLKSGMYFNKQPTFKDGFSDLNTVSRVLIAIGFSILIIYILILVYYFKKRHHVIQEAMKKIEDTNEPND